MEYVLTMIIGLCIVTGCNQTPTTYNKDTWQSDIIAIDKVDSVKAGNIKVGIMYRGMNLRNLEGVTYQTLADEGAKQMKQIEEDVARREKERTQ